jgi:hypothetical protein
MHFIASGKYIVTPRLKAGIVGKEEAAVTRQKRGKHVSAAKNKHVTIEDEILSMRSEPRL